MSDEATAEPIDATPEPAPAPEPTGPLDLEDAFDFSSLADDLEGEPAGDPDDAEEPADEPADEPAPVAAKPKAGGTKEQPLKITDLAEDQFVELTVNGEPEVVSMRELADGHLRQRAFNRKVNELNEVRKKAEAVATQAETRTKQAQQWFVDTVSDANKLDEFMESNLPDVWAEATKRAIRRQFQLAQAPEAQRLEYYRRRDAKRHEAALARERQQRETLENQHRERETRERMLTTMKPPFDRARAEFGNPRLSKEQSDQYWRLVGKELRVRAEVEGRDLSSDEMFEVMSQGFRRVGVEQPAAEPKATPPPPRAARKPKAKREESFDWDFTTLDS